jgi:hypothetical protein
MTARKRKPLDARTLRQVARWLDARARERDLYGDGIVARYFRDYALDLRETAAKTKKEVRRER